MMFLVVGPNWVGLVMDKKKGDYRYDNFHQSTAGLVQGGGQERISLWLPMTGGLDF